MVKGNKFSWAVKLSNAQFCFLHFKDCFFFVLILTAAKQICECFVVCLHKDQLFSNVSAGKEKYVFVLIVNWETTETTLGQIRLCSEKKKEIKLVQTCPGVILKPVVLLN